MKKHLLFIVLGLIIISSCSPYTMLYKNFTFRYSNQNIGIDSLININGYYSYSTIRTDSIRDIGLFRDKIYIFQDTVRTNILFYNNKICTFNFIDANLDSMKYDTVAKRKYTNWREKQRLTESLFQEIVDNSCKDCIYKFYKRGSGWGSYIISNDTIKIQYVEGFGWGSSLGANGELWFKIIDRNTIIAIKNIGPLSQPKNEQNVQVLNDKYTFVPVSTIPSPDNAWILNQKWFWENESERREYMRKMK